MADSTTKKNLSTREWRYVISIIIIVEAFIAYLSFNYASNASALGYVSFAGTLISIILAVLAIGYTYGESVKQKNSSDTVVSQINKLNDVIKEIDLSVNSLEEISEVSTELKVLAKSFKHGITRIDDTHKEVGIITSLLNRKFDINNTAKSNEETSTTNDNITTKISKTKNKPIELSFYILLLYKQTKEKTDIYKFIVREFNYYFLKANKDASQFHKMSEPEISFIRDYYTGGITTCINLLARLGLISIEEDNVTILTAFEKKIYNEISDNFEVDDTLFSRVAELMVLDIEGIEQTW